MEALSYKLQESIEYYFSQLSAAEQSHCLRVKELSLSLAKAMNLPIEKHRDLAQAAKYHDIGKIRIPRKILEKPGKLDPSEREVIMVHSKFSGQLLEQTGHNRNVIRFALLHHENFDGTGYPFGLSEEKIPIEARIIRVADAFDALHSKRAYKDALPLDICLQVLEKDARVFDAEILEVLEFIL